MCSLAPKVDDRTERIHRLSMAIKDNVLLSEDLLSIAVQASAKKQKINHDYSVTMSVQKSSVKSASKFFTSTVFSFLLIAYTRFVNCYLIDRCLRKRKQRESTSSTGIGFGRFKIGEKTSS